ncbi:MAG: c-type cytochrome [Ferruginibacter sp.]
MKKYCIILSLSVLCFSCANNDTKSTDTKESSKETSSVMDNPDYDKGLNLIAKSDCFTCHKLRDASTGPAYGAVAAKYENTEANRSMLADKIIAGGQGVWGQIPMAAHPSLSKDDAITMVKYIMLLKEEKK